MRLKAQETLKFEDKIRKYLDADTLQNLHTLNGKDYTNEISIKHLLAHTSGLPDYFQIKDKNGKSLLNKITKNNDQSWTFNKAIEYSKLQKPLFAPGAKGKAHYSDTNFQLLGKIIENVTEKPFPANCEELIFKPLGLKQTYLYQDIKDHRPAELYFSSNKLKKI